MRLFSVAILFLLLPFATMASTDSSHVFGFNEFMAWVQKHHPIMVRAALIAEQAQIELLGAQGNFDPQIQGDFRQKDFEDKTYYRIGQGGLYVPAWFGADVSVNYRYAEGQQLNPENYVPNPGIMEFGISVPLSPALWMDKRRAALKNAKLYVQSAAWQQTAATNQLYLECALDYWNWALHYERLAVVKNALTIAERQYNFVRGGVIAGDRAAIDSIEASLLLQQVQINLLEAQMLLDNARYQLAVHLWLEGNIPLEISDSLHPEPVATLANYWEQPNFSTFLDAHPILNNILVEREMYRVDEQLYKAFLFPNVKLKYQMLAGLEPLDFDVSSGSNGLQNNHALGIGVSIPIFWATERANLRQAKLKIRDTDLKIALKKAELIAKYKQYNNESDAYNAQIKLLGENLQGFQALAAAEETLFNQGESSLFLVNTRVTRLLDAQLKLADLHFKRFKAQVQWYVAAGGGF